MCNFPFRVLLFTPNIQILNNSNEEPNPRPFLNSLYFNISNNFLQKLNTMLKATLAFYYGLNTQWEDISGPFRARPTNFR